MSTARAFTTLISGSSSNQSITVGRAYGSTTFAGGTDAALVRLAP
jgi:hypothetical protein